MGKRERTAMEVLQGCGAIITGGHFVYQSGRHGDVYVNKDGIYTDPRAISSLCRKIAEAFRATDIDVVVGPEKGAIVISQNVAHFLSWMKKKAVLSIYAERSESTVLSRGEGAAMETQDICIFHYPVDTKTSLRRGEKLIKRSNFFELKRGYAPLVNGKNVLVVEDILNTGDTVSKVISAVRIAGGTVVGIGALCDRGTPDIRVKIPNPPRTIALVELPLTTWNEIDCPLCKEKKPIRTDLGKGAELLTTKKLA